MRIALIAAGAALALVAGCGKKGAGPEATVPEFIEGTFLLYARNEQGELRLPDEIEKLPVKRRRHVFTKDTLTTEVGNEPLAQPIKLDATKKPGHIDFISPSNKKGEPDIVNYGIYQMEGDTLIICYTTGATNKPEDRPKEFATGGKYTTDKYKRQ